MTTLRLGVVVLPHPVKGGKKVITTGQLAHWLEDDYGIIGNFVDFTGRPVIRNLFAEQVKKQISSVVRGKPTIGEPMQKALDTIQKDFRTFIRAKQAEAYPSPIGLPVPTIASGGNPRRGIIRYAGQEPIRMGYRHTRSGSRPMRYRLVPRRPSFFDTGVYLMSFKAWMTQ